jgi:quercetin dioxygenase-like cupin family protein
VQVLGVVAACTAWLGWFQIAPALGFPTMGPAAMVNRVFLPRSDPGAWLGWVLMALGLVGVTVLYALAVTRGWVRPGVPSGLLLGIAAWAITGMVLMVIIGHVSQPAPAPPAPPGPPLPSTPDPMHATFLMLHLGGLAPIEALLAWLLFGAVIGATFATTEPGSATDAVRARRAGVLPAAGLLGLVAALAGTVWIDGPKATEAAAQEPERVETSVLATGPAAALPEGAVFVSVIELPQAPGAKLGPHAHVPGFAYVLRGRETIAFPAQPTLQVDAGQAGFMGGLAVHAHENRHRVPAAALAVGLLAIGAAISVVSMTRIAGRGLFAALASLLVVAGAVALWDPWVNDWFFIGVRPAAARGGVMPLPNATRVYESPDLQGVSPGPYTENLQVITVRTGGRFAVDQEPGPEMLLVLSGQGTVSLNGGPPTSLGTSDAALAQQGTSVQISNPGEQTLSVLSFSLVGSPAGQ